MPFPFWATAASSEERAHTGHVTTELPSEHGASKEQLAESHAKSSVLLADTRKATTITNQFHAAAAEDASTNPDAKAVVTASANRAADLNDLDLFLSEVERAPFTGKLKNRYASWIDERKKLKSDEEAVATWLGRAHAVTSPDDATKEMEEANTLIVKYSTRSKFSDSTKAAVWRIKARLVLTDALAHLADAQYRTAVNTKLPLEKGNNAVKVAVETLRGLKAMIRLLDSDAKIAEEEKEARRRPSCPGGR